MAADAPGTSISADVDGRMLELVCSVARRRHLNAAYLRPRQAVDVRTSVRVLRRVRNRCTTLEGSVVASRAAS
jgi:hypothetical protein